MINKDEIFLKKILIKSGKIAIKSYSRGLRVSEKKDKSLMTNIDRQIGRYICSEICHQYPQDSVECEDGLYKKYGTGKNTWYVDPLDGTTNFVHNYPFFAISISCMRKSDRSFIVSGIYIPYFKQLFLVEGSSIPTLNGEKIQTSFVKKFSRALVLSGMPRYVSRNSVDARRFLGISSLSDGTRRSGSAAFDLAYVAAGFADAYYHFNLKPWDFAAGCHLVQNAGGKIGNIRSKKFNFLDTTIIASNKFIYSRLRSKLQ